MKTIAIVQARMGSTRLPGKVLKDISGQPAIYWTALAAANAIGVDAVWLATSTNPGDNILAEWARSVPWLAFFRGSEEDVLDRFVQCARIAGAWHVVRLTGDCPLMDPHVIEQTIALFHHTHSLYASNVDPPTWPDGLDVQVMSWPALEDAHARATRKSDRETVCEFMTRNKRDYPSANLTCPIPSLAQERWVLDTADDLEFIRRLVEQAGGMPPSYASTLATLRRAPHLRDINNKWTRNERFFESIEREAT